MLVILEGRARGVGGVSGGEQRCVSIVWVCSCCGFLSEYTALVLVGRIRLGMPLILTGKQDGTLLVSAIRSGSK